MIMVSNFFFNFINFCVTVSFLINLIASGIMFSTVVNVEFAANPVILGILLSVPIILES